MNSDWVGKNLGKVQVESLLARGGMAEVYLGTHTTLERKVAVKILRNPGEEDSEALERFQREARVVASLRHPNIVQVYDFDTIDNDPYIVMEYVEGPSLSKYLHFLHQNGNKLELPHVVRMLEKVASALQYAHNNKIVHRDIKPGNILLSSPSTKIEVDKPLPDDFEPVLTDFGLIRFLDSARQTTTGITAGTPAYMSPEQAQGEATDGLTDVYSLGIVLYEMLAGKLPFDGETTMGILLKHVNQPPDPIPGLSPFMQNVLDKALAKKPKDRFQSPMEFAKAFSAAVDINPATIQMDALASDEPYTFQTEGLSAADEQKKTGLPKLSGWLRYIIAGVLILVFGILVFLYRSPSTASEPPPSTESLTASMAPPTTTSTSTVTPVPVNLVTSLVIHFRDENAIADQAFLEVYRVPAAPDGNQYEVWLFNNRERISLGLLSLDPSGNGELTYTNEQGINLVSKYDRAEVTVEPQDDTNPNPTKLVAFTFTLPPDGLTNVRYLISSFPGIPEKKALIQGLYANIQKINEFAVAMEMAYTSGDEDHARQRAEAIMNLIVGAQSHDYKDWDKNDTIVDESDGYGLQLNGSNLGYYGAVYTEANNAVTSSDPSEPYQNYGRVLKASVQNLAQWTPQLQELLITILEAPIGTDLKEQITDALNLADRMLNGLDEDGDGSIKPELGEGGAQSAYEFAYAMADMPLTSTGLIAGIGTGTPGAIIAPTSNGGSVPTQHIPPGQVKTNNPPGQQDKTKKAPSNNNNVKN